MKIWLDDDREAPEGWLRAYQIDEVIQHLKTTKVLALDLDHNIGEVGANARSGRYVLDWLAAQVLVNGFVPPADIKTHSANPWANFRMGQVIEKIQQQSVVNTTQNRNWNGSFELAVGAM